MDYWPSYSGATPDARSAYLFWLASGRKDPKADLGYVFLYFYGLERRALNELIDHPDGSDELAVIEAEVRRLLSIYTGSGSFQSYANSFLDYLTAKRQGQTPDIPSIVPSATNHYTLSLDLRLGLGAFAVKGKPVPPEWALVWLYSDPNVRLRTPATRCQKEFDSLFIAEYRKQFGDGLKLEENKTRLKVVHRTASVSFGSATVSASLDLPDVSVLTGPINKFQQVAEICTNQLEAYSRFLGRNPDQVGTLEAMLMLPSTLWPSVVRTELEDLQRKVETSDDLLVVPFLDLQLRLPESGNLNKSKFGALSRALGTLGLGIEPDPRFGGALPETNDAIALFKANGLDEDRPTSPGFIFAALAVQLAAVVAHSDGDFGTEEEAILTGHLAQWLHLNEQERLRLSARLHLMRKTKPGLTGLQKRIDSLAGNQKAALGDLLILVAHADGVVSTVEVKALEKIFRMLGFKEGTIYSKLHGAASEPITVRQAGPPDTGFKLRPRPTEPVLAGGGMTLDMAKVAALRIESVKVADLLGSIFKEENRLAASVPLESEPVELSKEPTLLGLDPDHAGLLRTLLARPQWSRAELEDICSERGMMVDGALERINEAAFEAFEEPLIEGDDPLDVYRDRLLERTI